MLCAFGLFLAAMTAGASTGNVIVLDVDGAIGPGTSEYISSGLERARASGAQLVVLRIDTPGGLDASMRAIVKDILASETPVAAYIAPTGARAASAGTFLAYASHFAAMAPGTNLGAATPVSLAGPGGASPGKDKAGAADAMGAKVVNDAAAYIRSLAALRGRNAEWGERAVREGVSASAEEALAAKVVDLVVPDLQSLLTALDGREVRLAAGSVGLATAGAEVVEVPPGWRTRLLQAIGNPSVALLLLMIGLYGLVFELASPGFGVSGTLGAICLLLGLFALHLLPVSYAGIALIALGVALMVAEGLSPSFGILGLGGVVAFVLGGTMLLRDDAVPHLSVPTGFLVGLGAVSALVLAASVRFALRSRRLPLRAGAETLPGTVGRIVQASGNEGWAEVRGERWQVRGVSPLAPGDKVRVVAVRGLTLEVSAPVAGQNGDMQ